MSLRKTKKQAQPENKIYIGSKIFDVFLIVFMLILSVIFLYPFLNVVATSLSSNRMITTGQVTFFPKEIMVDGYKMLFKEQNILGAYWNTCLLYTSFFTMQLNRFINGPFDEAWGMVREAQRRAALSIPAVFVLPTTNLSLSDRCV